jgi:hypothetical protein
MIQRIQTIFLLGVTVCMSLTLVFSLWQSSPGEEPQQLFALYLLRMTDGELTRIYWPFAITAGLAFLAVVVSVIEIFSYKNRILQMKLGLFNTLIIFGSVGSAFYFIYELDTVASGSIDIGIFLPVSAIIFNRFAGRYIKKDEDLVRSVDRLR